MKRFLWVFVIFAFVLSSCKPDEPIITPIPPSTPYQIEIPPGFPTDLNIPSDNPMTVEGIWLGRHLFYDGRISGRTHPDSLMSCATCHVQSRGFSKVLHNTESLSCPCRSCLREWHWFRGKYLWGCERRPCFICPGSRPALYRRWPTSSGRRLP